MIYRKQEFVQDETDDPDFPIKVIDQLEQVGGDDVRFIGRATLNMQTPIGIQQFPISFEIEADSIEEAFEDYVEAAGPRIEEVRQRVQEHLSKVREDLTNRIITPDQMQAQRRDIISLDDFKNGN